MMFRIGQQVVCIGHHDRILYQDCKLPEVGQVYTIRGVDETGGVLLEEIVNANDHYCIDSRSGLPIDHPGEPSFEPDYFRPLVKRNREAAIEARIAELAKVLGVVQEPADAE